MITFDEILFTQSPALFLAAILLLLCYFVRRGNHHARAVVDLLLAILSIAAGIALYYFGMLRGLFTIKDFWQVRTPGLVGLVLVLLLAVYLLFKSAGRSLAQHRAEKAANRLETAHQKELEEVRKQAYASGMADAKAETRLVEAAPESAPLSTDTANHERSGESDE